MQLNKDKTPTIVIVYGPNEDDIAKDKEEIWEKLTDFVEI